MNYKYSDNDIRKAIEAYSASHNGAKFNPKAALIDMDGILYDSMPNHATAWYKLCQDLKIESNRDEFFIYEGMTGVGIMQLLFKRAFNKDITPEEAMEYYKIKAKYFVAMGEPECMPYAVVMLNTLRSHDIQRILVTGSAQKSVINKIEHDYPGLFTEEGKVTAYDVTHGKPDPEPYLKGQMKAGVKANEAMVIENAPLGVTAGVAAGCFTVAVTTGPVPAEDMAKAGANLIMPSMKEFTMTLPRIIKIAKDFSL